MDQGYHNHAGVQLTDFVDHFILGQQRLDVDKLPDSPIWVFPPEFWYIHSSASFTFCLQFITVSLCERSAVQFCISSIFFFLSAYLLGFLRFFSLIDWLVWSGPFEMRSVFSAAGGALVSGMHLGSFSFDTSHVGFIYLAVMQVNLIALWRPLASNSWFPLTKLQNSCVNPTDKIDSVSLVCFDFSVFLGIYPRCISHPFRLMKQCLRDRHIQRTYLSSSKLNDGDSSLLLEVRRLLLLENSDREIVDRKVPRLRSSLKFSLTICCVLPIWNYQGLSCRLSLLLCATQYSDQIEILNRPWNAGFI